MLVSFQLLAEMHSDACARALQRLSGLVAEAHDNESDSGDWLVVACARSRRKLLGKKRARFALTCCRGLHQMMLRENLCLRRLGETQIALDCRPGASNMPRIR